MAKEILHLSFLFFLFQERTHYTHANQLNNVVTGFALLVYTAVSLLAQPTFFNCFHFIKQNEVEDESLRWNDDS